MKLISTHTTRLISKIHRAGFLSYRLLLIGVLFLLISTMVQASGGESGVTGIFSVVNEINITAVRVTDITTQSARVTWQTDVAADSRVFYDTETGATFSVYRYSQQETPLVQSHSLLISGLSAGRTYHYRVVSRFETLEAVSDDYVFITASAAGGGVAPVYTTTPVTPSASPSLTSTTAPTTSTSAAPTETTEASPEPQATPLPVGPAAENSLLVHIDQSTFGSSVTEEGTVSAIIAGSEDAVFTLSIPAGTSCTDNRGNRVSEISIVPLSDPAPPLPAGSVLGVPYECRPSGAQFDTPLKIEIVYTQAQLEAGYIEDSFVIAYYNSLSGEWEMLESVVDKTNRIVSAWISHFSTYALLGDRYGHLSSPVFEISDLEISPQEVFTSEEVAIRVRIANRGTIAGLYQAAFTLNGRKSFLREIALDSGLSTTLAYSITPDQAGLYRVEIDDLGGWFSVLNPPQLQLDDLIVRPAKAVSGEKITLSVIALNRGDAAGDFSLTLRVNGTLLQEQSIHLESGGSRTLVFDLPYTEPGRYSYSMNELTGTFEIVPAGIGWYWWWLLLVILALIILFLLRRYSHRFRQALRRPVRRKPAV